MKAIKYKLCTVINIGTEEKPESAEMFSDVMMPYSERNLDIAQKEAYNGVYSVEDVEVEEAPPTDSERIAELEEALELLLSGVTE